jgi:hypothetical protein
VGGSNWCWWTDTKMSVGAWNIESPRLRPSSPTQTTFCNGDAVCQSSVFRKQWSQGRIKGILESRKFPSLGRLGQWYSTGGTRRHLRRYVDYTICITCIVYQQLWGYRVEEKLYLGVRKQKTLNTTALGDSKNIVGTKVYSRVSS